MNIGQYLNKPEYIFRPTQLCRRILRVVKRSQSKFEVVTLPWEIKIRVRPSECIGRSIVTMGVYDLSVTEVLWRLIDPCEITVDIGANIGYMTSIMAKRVGETGKVFAYEPHPEIYEEFCENKRMWHRTYGWNQIESATLALSNISDIGILNIPNHFEENRGVASLGERLEEIHKPTCQCLVNLVKLDDIMDATYPVAVIKLDVEGHELKVLEGGVKVITRWVRDIVFEEHAEYPNKVSSYLESLGFTVFRFYKDFWGPRLKLPTAKLKGSLLPWEPPNYLATKDPSRAVKRLSKRGWQAFSGN